jgi:hypothetical protein
MRSYCRRCVAMYVRFDSYHQAFRRHATVFLFGYPREFCDFSCFFSDVRESVHFVFLCCESMSVFCFFYGGVSYDFFLYYSYCYAVFL